MLTVLAVAIAATLLVDTGPHRALRLPDSWIWEARADIEAQLTAAARAVAVLLLLVTTCCYACAGRSKVDPAPLAFTSRLPSDSPDRYLRLSASPPFHSACRTGGYGWLR